MGLIDVTELLEDPDFAESFRLIRTTGQWNEGRFEVNAPESIPFYGPVQPPSSQDMEILPEGERLKGVMCFWVKGSEVYLTREDGIGDLFLWRGNHYKIIQVNQWADYGWVKAFGIRMEGK